MPREVKKLLLAAWNNHQWIYDRLDGKWFTPEEFKAEWHIHVTTHNINRYMARSPELGIAESLENLRRVLERTVELHKKLQGYYEVELRRKKK